MHSLTSLHLKVENSFFELVILVNWDKTSNLLFPGRAYWMRMESLWTKEHIFIYLFWERERVCVSTCRRDKGRENLKEAPHPAWSPMRRSYLRTARSWLKLKSRVSRLTNWATQAPQRAHFIANILIQKQIFSFKMKNLSKESWLIMNK